MAGYRHVHPFQGAAEDPGVLRPPPAAHHERPAAGVPRVQVHTGAQPGQIRLAHQRGGRGVGRGRQEVARQEKPRRALRDTPVGKKAKESPETAAAAGQQPEEAAIAASPVPFGLA